LDLPGEGRSGDQGRQSFAERNHPLYRMGPLDQSGFEVK
jgi:hypothetical protein